jgi:hypothetical protein
MDTNRKVFRNSSSTTRAELRGIFSWYLDDCSGSLFRFPAQYIEKTKPSSISHRPVECRSTIPSIHFLDADGIVEPDQLIGYLEVEIPSLLIDFIMGSGYQHPGFSPAARAFNPPGESLLSHGKNSPGVGKETGVAYLHTLGGSEKRLQSDIDTYRFACRGQWFKGYTIAGKTSIPLTCRTMADGHRLDVAFNRAGEPEFESADVLDIKVFTIQLPTRPFQGKGIISVSTLEPRETRFGVTVVKPAKEALIGSIQTFNYILKYLRAYFLILREGLLEFRKFLLLVKGRDGLVVMPVGTDTLFQGTVVELSAQRKPAFSFLNSLRAGLNSVLERLFPLHDSIIPNIEKGGKPFRASPSVSPALKSGVLDGVFL